MNDKTVPEIDDPEADRLAIAFLDGYNGDETTLSWWTLTEEQRASFRDGIRAVLRAKDNPPLTTVPA